MTAAEIIEAIKGMSVLELNEKLDMTVVTTVLVSSLPRSFM